MEARQKYINPQKLSGLLMCHDILLPVFEAASRILRLRSGAGAAYATTGQCQLIHYIDQAFAQMAWRLFVQSPR